jgi:hypothetical protein
LDNRFTGAELVVSDEADPFAAVGVVDWVDAVAAAARATGAAATPTVTRTVDEHNRARRIGRKWLRIRANNVRVNTNDWILMIGPSAGSAPIEHVTTDNYAEENPQETMQRTAKFPQEFLKERCS